jgi:transcriptional regulator with XRE-family HTH domain
MSAEIIKRNIIRILDERDWSLPELEKKAGTNRNIYELIRGRNTNPSAQLVRQVAHTLNVDYKELLEDYDEEEYIKDYSLLAEAYILIIEELELLPLNVNVSYSSFNLLVQEVCSYATQLGNKNIDRQFVKWSIMKYYSVDKK